MKLKRWWFAAAAPALVTLGCVVLAVTPTFRAFGDQAKIELQARSVLSADTPLTGLVGRFDWNHPAPVMFWLLSPAAMVAHRTSTPLRVTNALICAVAIVAAFVLAWRLGRRFFTVIVLATALALVGLPAGVLTTYWNPSLPVPFTILLIVLTAGVAAGRTRDLIGVVVVGSIMVGTHVGTLVIVGICGAVALLWSGLDAWRARRAPDRWLSTLIGTVAAIAVFWVLPLIGVIRHVSGNLVFLISYFRRAPGGQTGLLTAERIVAADYAWRPVWLGGPARYAGRGFSGLVPYAGLATRWWLLVPAITLALGFAVARWRRDELWCRYIALIAVLVCGSILAISRGDQPFAYTFEWRTIIVPLSVLIPLVPVCDHLVTRRPKAQTAFAAGAAIAIAVASFTAIPHFWRGSKLDPIAEGSVTAIAGALDHQQIDGRRIALRSDPVNAFGAMLFDSIVNELDRRGAHVIVAQNALAKAAYGDRRAGRAAEADERWQFVATPERFATLLAEPGARVVWSQFEGLGIIAVPRRPG